MTKIELRELLTAKHEEATRTGGVRCMVVAAGVGAALWDRWRWGEGVERVRVDGVGTVDVFSMPMHDENEDGPGAIVEDFDEAPMIRCA